MSQYYSQFFPRPAGVDPTVPPPTGDFRVVACVQIADPAAEPLTIDEAKLHLRVDFPDDDTIITQLIVGARRFVEKATGRAFIDQKFLATLDGFPTKSPFKIELPRSPVTAVDFLKYDDDSGVEQTLVINTDFRLDKYTEPARIFPALYGFWPVAVPKPSGVRIQFSAGLAVGKTDETALAAMKLIIGHFYENREASITGTTIDELPLGIQTLLGQLKVRAHR